MTKRLNISITDHLFQELILAKPLLQKTVSAICARAIKQAIHEIEVPPGLTRQQARQAKLRNMTTKHWLEANKIDLNRIEW